MNPYAGSRGTGPDSGATPDPRTHVTPDAFEISPDLMGLPLAGPWSRLGALVVDGILIAVLSRSGFLLLGGAAAAFFLRLATSRKGGDYLARAFRGAVGCLGLGILLVTGCGLFVLVVSDDADDEGGLVPGIPMADIRSGEVGTEVPVSLGDVFSGISDVRAFRDAETPEEAREAAGRVARRLEAAGAPEADVSEALHELAPADAPWADELDAIVRQALRTRDSGAGPDSPSPPGSGPEPGIAADSLPLASALDRYARLLEDSAAATDPDAGPAPEDSVTAAERVRLRARIVSEVGADTLAALHRRLDEEASDRATVEERLERVREELLDVREAGVVGWIRRLVDDLGLAFGWGAIYMTVFMTWWNGQTPGKKLLRIRVRQLDGTALTWWESFERAGGYAAGFATGLLGFAQVFWDPNRQAIHDKIAETVVTSEQSSAASRSTTDTVRKRSPSASPPPP